MFHCELPGLLECRAKPAVAMPVCSSCITSGEFAGRSKPTARAMKSRGAQRVHSEQSTTKTKGNALYTVKARSIEQSSYLISLASPISSAAYSITSPSSRSQHNYRARLGTLDATMATTILGEMRLWELPDEFICQPVSGEQSLRIERSGGRASVIAELFRATDNSVVIYGLLGAVRLLSDTHYLVITGRELVGTYRNAPVFKITAIKSLHCKGESPNLSFSQKKEEAYLEALLQVVMATPGLFFSYDVDLTNNAQRRSSLRNEHQPLWQQADTRFVWNNHLLELLLEASADKFILPVIQGSFQTMEILLRDKPINFTLISRRCTRRIGTRMWRRGADLDGSVANFVETEQIIEVNGFYASYTQVRGSIPLFWEQIVDLSYKPKIQPVPREETSRAVERHFQDLSERYTSVLALNLINQQGGEGVLSVAYANAMKDLGWDAVKYVPFDFHRICGNIHFERLASLHDQISEDLLKQRYFLVDGDGNVVEEQKGVVRTNCIDCLDRTNVTQSLLGRKAAEEQLRKVGLLGPYETIADHPQFDTSFNLLWANHGDDISIQYSGTPALKGDFVRYGKRSFGGLIQDGISSLSRYYRNNFSDGHRQDALDLVAGHYKPRRDKILFEPGMLATYLPLVAAVVVACISASALSLWRVSKGQDHIMYTVLWATFATSLGAAIRMNGRQLCSRPRLRRLN